MVPTVLFVRSSAGSGKTHSLALRYINLLLETGGNSSSIVAITFTNRAAKEMRERLLEMMKSLALGLSLSGRDLLERIVPSTSELAKEQARRVVENTLERILKDYSAFYVGTIDSLVHLILQASFFKLGLPVQSEITEDSLPLQEYVLDILIQRIVEDQDVMAVFNRFLDRYLEIEGESPSWYPRRILLDAISMLWEEEWKHNRPFRHEEGESLAAIEGRIRRALQVLGSTLEENPAIRLKKRVMWAIQNKDFKRGCFATHIQEHLLKGSAPPTEPILALWKTLQEEISSYYKHLSESKFYPYLEVYELFRQTFFKEVNQARRQITIEQLNPLLQKIMEREHIVPEIYYSVSARFLHFLIDEFQDTNHLQWRNIEVLVEEALSSGGSLFLVGDPKQAIYRFRGGRAELMGEVVEKFRAYGPIESVLSTNYRSLGNIVNFNNIVFAPSNLQQLARSVLGETRRWENLLKCYEASHQDWRWTGGYVYAEMAKDEESCIERLKELLLQIRRAGFKDGEIAILVRKNAEVQRLAEVLLGMGLRVDSEFTIHVFHNPIVREIIHFLRFLDRPEDRVSLIGFLLGEVFRSSTGMEKREIIDWLLTKGIGETENILNWLKKDFAEVWQPKFNTLCIGSVSLSIYDLIVLFIKEWKIFQLFPRDTAFILHLLEIAKDMEDKGEHSIKAFLKLFEGDRKDDIFLLKTRGVEDAVKVTTIHKAKGLEFPCVIVPFVRLDAASGRGRTHSSRFVVPSEDGLKLLHITKEYRRGCAELDHIYRWKEEEEILDDLNILYVAFTRPKRSLYLLFPEQGGNAFAEYIFSLKELSPFRKRNVIEIGQEQKGGAFEVARYPTVGPLVGEIDVAKGLKRKMGRTEISSMVSIRSKRRGELIHRILAFIGHLEEGDVASQLRKIVCQVCVSEAEEMETLLLKLFSEERIRRFFLLHEGDRVYTEKEVVDRSGNTFKVDRLVERRGHVEVLEFKTGEEKSEEHRAQLLGYVRLIKEIYGDKTVEAYLVYVDEREVVRI